MLVKGDSRLRGDDSPFSHEKTSPLLTGSAQKRSFRHVFYNLFCEY